MSNCTLLPCQHEPMLLHINITPSICTFWTSSICICNVTKMPVIMPDIHVG